MTQIGSGVRQLNTLRVGIAAHGKLVGQSGIIAFARRHAIGDRPVELDVARPGAVLGNDVRGGARAGNRDAQDGDQQPDEQGGAGRVPAELRVDRVAGSGFHGWPTGTGVFSAASFQRSAFGTENLILGETADCRLLPSLAQRAAFDDARPEPHNGVLVGELFLVRVR